MRTLAVVNQKGGVGKTTTTAALGVLLARQGRGVHLVDMDHQADLTSALGQNDAEGLLFRALSDRTALPVIAIDEHLSLTPSSIDLAAGETQFVAAVGREFLLRTALGKAKLTKETIVLIDCPPSLGILTSNCLAVADALIVVVKPGGFEMRAVATLEALVNTYREQVNPKLTIAGVILTEMQPRRGDQRGGGGRDRPTLPGAGTHPLRSGNDVRHQRGADSPADAIEGA